MNRKQAAAQPSPGAGSVNATQLAQVTRLMTESGAVQPGSNVRVMHLSPKSMQLLASQQSAASTIQIGDKKAACYMINPDTDLSKLGLSGKVQLSPHTLKTATGTVPAGSSLLTGQGPQRTLVLTKQGLAQQVNPGPVTLAKTTGGNLGNIRSINPTTLNLSNVPSSLVQTSAGKVSIPKVFVQTSDGKQLLGQDPMSGNIVIQQSPSKVIFSNASLGQTISTSTMSPNLSQGLISQVVSPGSKSPKAVLIPSKLLSSMPGGAQMSRFTLKPQQLFSSGQGGTASSVLLKPSADLLPSRSGRQVDSANSSLEEGAQGATVTFRPQSVQSNLQAGLQTGLVTMKHQDLSNLQGGVQTAALSLKPQQIATNIRLSPRAKLIHTSALSPGAAALPGRIPPIQQIRLIRAPTSAGQPAGAVGLQNAVQNVPISRVGINIPGIGPQSIQIAGLTSQPVQLVGSRLPTMSYSLADGTQLPVRIQTMSVASSGAAPQVRLQTVPVATPTVPNAMLQGLVPLVRSVRPSTTVQQSNFTTRLTGMTTNLSAPVANTLGGNINFVAPSSQEQTVMVPVNVRGPDGSMCSVAMKAVLKQAPTMSPSSQGSSTVLSTMTTAASPATMTSAISEQPTLVSSTNSSQSAVASAHSDTNAIPISVQTTNVLQTVTATVMSESLSTFTHQRFITSVLSEPVVTVTMASSAIPSSSTSVSSSSVKTPVTTSHQTIDPTALSTGTANNPSLPAECESSTAEGANKSPRVQGATELQGPQRSEPVPATSLHGRQTVKELLDSGISAIKYKISEETLQMHIVPSHSTGVPHSGLSTLADVAMSALNAHKEMEAGSPVDPAVETLQKSDSPSEEVRSRSSGSTCNSPYPSGERDTSVPDGKDQESESMDSCSDSQEVRLDQQSSTDAVSLPSFTTQPPEAQSPSPGPTDQGSLQSTHPSSQAYSQPAVPGPVRQPDARSAGSCSNASQNSDSFQRGMLSKALSVQSKKVNFRRAPGSIMSSYKMLDMNICGLQRSNSLTYSQPGLNFNKQASRMLAPRPTVMIPKQARLMERRTESQNSRQQFTVSEEESTRPSDPSGLTTSSNQEQPRLSPGMSNEDGDKTNTPSHDENHPSGTAAKTSESEEGRPSTYWQTGPKMIEKMDPNNVSDITAFIAQLDCQSSDTEVLIATLMSERAAWQARLEEVENARKFGQTMQKEVQTRQFKGVAKTRQLRKRARDIEAEEAKLQEQIQAATQDISKKDSVQNGLHERLQHCVAALQALPLAGYPKKKKRKKKQAQCS